MFNFQPLAPKDPHAAGDEVWYLWDENTRAEKHKVLQVIDGGRRYVIDDLVAKNHHPTPDIYRVVSHGALRSVEQ